MKGSGFSLTQLRYFVAACETLSTARAAELLGVAQSGVSTAITHLEGVTGTTLFVRIPTKGLRLTAEGRELRRIAVDVLARSEEISRFGLASSRPLDGTVRVACFRTLVPSVLPRLLDRLRRRYPALRIDMVETTYDETLQRLRTADVLLGVVYDAGIPADITVEHVASCRPYVLVGTGHPLANRPVLDLAELDGQQMVTLDIETSRQYAHRVLRSSGAQVREAVATSSVEALRAIVAAGECFAVLNQHPGHDQTVIGRHVVAIPIRGEVEIPRIAVVSRPEYRKSARAVAVRDALREVGAQITKAQLLPAADPRLSRGSAPTAPG